MQSIVSVKTAPIYDILDIAGQLKPKKKKFVLEARRSMEKVYNRTRIK